MENRNNKLGPMIFVGIIASLVTIAAVVASVILIIDKKKKREDAELEEYLETSIN